MFSGFIALNKPRGISSQQAVSKIKFLLKQKGMTIDKIGHLGTLDPDADGVLIIALGRATRLFDYHLSKRKSYYSEFVFGVETDTLDTTGQIINKSDKIIDRPLILAILPNFIGTLNQTPPNFSAKLINGVRAYKLARKKQEIELAPKNITIFSFDLVDANLNDSYTYGFNIVCSSGTYIRSLARDLGRALDTFGSTRSITRTSSGSFHINDTVTLDHITNSNNTDYLLSLDDYIKRNFEICIISPQYEKQILNGVPVQLDRLPTESIFAVYLKEKLLGLGKVIYYNSIKIDTWLI
ncbi:MAG: tRNA pseudouridine(55) synthase TruB [Christensenellaceae bacterium]|jgi:tRNA pseudouridine55 synthase|nr:tRNA pseudouridine(55) synthase TruB [Christensenellaceae bacterium]